MAGRPSILVVEDTEPLRMILELALAEAGYEVIGVANGAEALRRCANRRFDAALLDVDLYYDWIHYSTAIGTEYLYRQLFSGSKKWVDERLRGNQVKYEVKVYRTRNNQFEVVE